MNEVCSGDRDGDKDGDDDVFNGDAGLYSHERQRRSRKILSIVPPFIQSSGRGAPRCRVHTPIATYSSSELRNQLPSSYSRTEHGPTSDYHDEWRGKGRKMRKMRREEKKG